jgi:hypothetical protein
MRATATANEVFRAVVDRKYVFFAINAQVVKLVDTPASGAGDLTVVEVRVFSWAPIQKTELLARFFIACNLAQQIQAARWTPISARPVTV